MAQNLSLLEYIIIIAKEWREKSLKIQVNGRARALSPEEDEMGYNKDEVTASKVFKIDHYLCT